MVPSLFYSKREKRLARGMNEEEKEAVPLRENFFKETDLKRSPCHRRTGPFLHPVFIFLSFFFLSILLVRLSPLDPSSW